MPACEVIYYREGDDVPVMAWLASIPAKARFKCLTYLSRLEEQGYELRRPIADMLGDGIYELRPSHQGVHYRILYFFSGQNVVILAHGLTKKDKVAKAEIERAVERRKRFEGDPESHSFTGE